MNDDIASRVIAEVGRLCTVDYVEFGDDDVFLDQMPEGDVYSDITPPFGRNTIPQRGVEIQNGRLRRTSDVIDSLGEELVTMRVHDSVSEPYSIPVSPRSRASSDLGYSGSVTSSPATHFNFPSNANNMYPGVIRRSNNTTDSRPIETGEQEPQDVAEARMPVSQDSDVYEMTHPRRGRAVIFNHDTFDNRMASVRLGSQVDVDALEGAFHGLGFQVTTHHNLTYTEIKDVIQSLSKEDHSDADCLSITVLTHGMDNGLLYARDALYPVDSLWTQFTADNCLSLAGKPKMFFVQACRGEKLDGGVSLVAQRRSMSETDSGSSSYKIPSYADFLVSFSSMPGFYSWRNPNEGTWFIQSLAQELDEHGDKRTLHDIMTRVCRRVALYYQSNAADTIWMHNQKQCPVFHSSLMRDLVFLPKT